MKRKIMMLLIAGALTGGCLTTDITEQEPTTEETPQPAQLDSVAIVKSPVIMKGLLGARSPRVRRSSEEWKRQRYYSQPSAVIRTLRWFKKEQRKDGSWHSWKDPEAMSTGLAVLCYLGNGETPASPEFGQTVEKALLYLLSIQDDNGRFKGTTKHPAIEHGIIAWSLCEAYGMTKNPMCMDAATKAVDVMLDAQLPSGLWSATYKTNGVPDIEASVWQIRALRSAKMAGLKDGRLVPAIQRTGSPLKVYVESDNHKGSLAPIILALKYSGNGRDYVTRRAIRTLEGQTMNWSSPQYDNPVYQWHYITEAAFMEGGEVWNSWHKNHAHLLPRTQIIIENGTKDNKGTDVDIGYWISPSKNERYGKIYATALCCQMLEVYAAYRPTFFIPVPEEKDPIQSKDDIEIEII
jgi:hypothetical protein